jgi:hypothetical protein
MLSVPKRCVTMIMENSRYGRLCVCVREGLTTYEIVMFDRSLALHERLAYL